MTLAATDPEGPVRPHRRKRPPFKERMAQNVFVRFIGELKPYRKIQSIVVGLTLCTAILGLPPPKIIGNLTDRLSEKGIREHLAANLSTVFLQFVTLALLSAFFSYWLAYTLNYLGQRFKLDMRTKIYSHMQSLSIGFFEKAQIGKLMSNITNDVSALDQIVSGSLATIVQDVATLVIVFAYLIYMSPSLALIALAVYPIYIANYFLFIGRIKSTHHDMREVRDEMYGDLQEKISGAMVVKSYAKERFEIRQFVGETRSILGLNIRISAMSTGLWTIAEVIGALGTALLLWWGGRLVIQGTLTTGDLMAFYGYIGVYLYGPTLRLIQINDQLARANAALWRIFRTLDTKPNVRDTPGAGELPEIKGDVHFEEVWFEYEPGQPVIKGIELDVKAGEMVAFVGQSGSGKTTMINLLQRNYDVTTGKIRVDGYDVRDVTLNSLRRQIGVVIQETILFNTTIRENIRYGRLDATDVEVEKAAEAANVAHVIEALPLGYDTKIGEQGIKLSGGEKQRIAIARAILSDPKILILDEATSALDSENRVAHPRRSRQPDEGPNLLRHRPPPLHHRPGRQDRGHGERPRPRGRKPQRPPRRRRLLRRTLQPAVQSRPRSGVD